MPEFRVIWEIDIDAATPEAAAALADKYQKTTNSNVYTVVDKVGERHQIDLDKQEGEPEASDLNKGRQQRFVQEGVK